MQVERRPRKSADWKTTSTATTATRLRTLRCFKDTRGLLQKLLSFRYQKPNQIPIEGTVSNPEFEPNQISEPEPDENRSSFDHGEVD